MERVSIIPGDSSINMMLVVPYGADDPTTVHIAETCVEEMGCYAIINRGFERSDHVDVMTDKADCHKVSHAIEDVVREEFLDPIKNTKERMVNRIVRHATKNNAWPNLADIKDRAMILYIVGVSDTVHKVAGEHVSMVIGCGATTFSGSVTCSDWRRDLLVYLGRDMWSDTMGSVCVADVRGAYAGKNQDNMNQFFRQHEPDKFVETMQLSFPACMHASKKQAVFTGICLGQILSKFITRTDFDQSVRFNIV